MYIYIFLVAIEIRIQNKNFNAQDKCDRKQSAEIRGTLEDALPAHTLKDISDDLMCKL